MSGPRAEASAEGLWRFGKRPAGAICRLIALVAIMDCATPTATPRSSCVTKSSAKLGDHGSYLCNTTAHVTGQVAQINQRLGVDETDQLGIEVV